jgi:hypothetical protein
MRSFLKALLIGAALSTSYFVPAVVSADDYWTNHWNWYDNTYRPYYYRGYGTNPGYNNNYYGPGYGNYNYYGPGYGGNGYGNYYGGMPYRNYTGTQNFGYGRTYGGGQAVNIGGMRFGWR